MTTRGTTRGQGTHATDTFGATHGQPPLLVLLPGLHGTCGLLRDFMQALGKDWPTLAIDYPRDRFLDYAALAGFVQPKLPAQRPFVLLGESFSGPVAIHLGAEARRNLRGVILSTAFAANPRPALGGFAALARMVPATALPVSVFEFWLLGRWANAHLHEQFRAVLGEVDPAVLAERLIACLKVDVRAELAKITTPLLYLRARQDRLVPAASAALVKQLAPQAQVRELDGPHCLLQAVPEAAAHVVREFVSGVTAKH
jgi:pimeloyl-ACP methyl ester carboxylesterase